MSLFKLFSITVTVIPRSNTPDLNSAVNCKNGGVTQRRLLFLSQK